VKRLAEDASRPDRNWPARIDPGLRRLREATVIMAAVAALMIVALPAIIVGLLAVLLTGQYPERIRRFLVSVYGYELRVEAYMGLLTDRYPPFSLSE
jgi:Domain of unknown function (DUF4389)